MFTGWLGYFRENPARHRAIEGDGDWDSSVTMSESTRRGFIRSFQRFELGESGDGACLLAKARRAGDPVYLAALTLLVEEEQKHSALFRRGLAHLGAPTLGSHWSDDAFTMLRRALGLRTELALFLIAEAVAMPYFVALAGSAPDPVLRTIGRRLEADERNHIRFQIDRLRQGFSHTPAPVRVLAGIVWSIIAVGAATTVVVDHGAALRSCGLRPVAYYRAAIRQFGFAARAVLSSTQNAPLGPVASRSCGMESIRS